MEYNFTEKWHWLPFCLETSLLEDGNCIEKKNYEFILPEKKETLSELSDSQIVARIICSYNGNAFKSGK